MLLLPWNDSSTKKETIISFKKEKQEIIFSFSTCSKPVCFFLLFIINEDIKLIFVPTLDVNGCCFHSAECLALSGQ